jgi:hypothetical protein
MARDHLDEPKTTFEGGSTRSAKMERFDLIPAEAQIANARRFGLGARKHGARNWQGGGAEFIAETISHLEGHVASLKMNGPFHADDDIGAAITNASMLAWFRAHKPDEFLKALGLYAAPPKSADTTDVPCYIDEAPFL